MSGGGVDAEATGSGSISSTRPSVSSSTTITMCGTARAMNSWLLRGAAAGEPADLDVRQGEEVALVGVQEVGRAGAVALARKLHGPLDLVTLSLDPDALAAIVHMSQYRPSTASAV